MAVKFGKAFGLSVTVFSTSISKKKGALNLLGADKFVVSSDQEQMKGLSKSLDFIVDTASNHPFEPYMSILKTAAEVKFSPAGLNMGMYENGLRKHNRGYKSDSRNDNDFCAAHKIYPQIEVIPIQYANEALERLIKRDFKYRFVIDTENTLK
ncbi:hypothetical protein DITRI_Ditri07aG0109300 [Diplodiscus trichospermus]